MSRTARVAPGGMLFHVLNRGTGRRQLFNKASDYSTFESILEETLTKRAMRICAYCLLPNHWHMILWPEADGDLAAFMHRLTITHVTRWQKQQSVVGEGHLYQGRFKSFAVESEDYYYQVLRYVERNALRANLAKQAEDWKWGSLWRCTHGTIQQRALIADWPLPRPRHWVEHVNRPQTDAEILAIRQSLLRGQPFGSPAWVQQTATALGLESTLREPGRPRKQSAE